MAQDSADRGDALLHRMLAAHGGLDRFHAIRDWRIVAERHIKDGAEPTGIRDEIYEESLLRDGSAVRTLLIKRRADEVLVYGHNGSAGFVVANGVVQATPEAEAEAYFRAHGEYYLRSLPFKWADPGVRVRYAGREPSGLELVEVRADDGVGPDSSDVWIAAVDPATHLLREARLTHRGGREITYRYSDYRDVAGVWLAFRLEYLSSGETTGENRIRTFDTNQGLEPELFTPAAHSDP